MKINCLIASLFILVSVSQAKRKYFLMPYPSFASRSSRSWGTDEVDLEDLILHRGQVKDGETFTVGASYQVDGQSNQKTSNRVVKPRGIVVDNSRFSRGVKNFQPSPLDLKIGDVGIESGQWISGTFPGEYTWRGLSFNPMRPRSFRSSPYQP